MACGLCLRSRVALVALVASKFEGRTTTSRGLVVTTFARGGLAPKEEGRIIRCQADRQPGRHMGSRTLKTDPEK